MLKTHLIISAANAFVLSTIAAQAEPLPSLGCYARAYDKAHPPPVAASAAAVGSPTAAQKLVDLNRASRAELKTLPGFGDAEAQRIIEGRPYNSKADLATQQVLGLAAYDQVKRQVVVDHRGTASRSKPRVASSAKKVGPSDAPTASAGPASSRSTP